MLRKFESQSNVMAYYLNSLNQASDGKAGFSESYEDVLLQVSYFVLDKNSPTVPQCLRVAVM